MFVSNVILCRQLCKLATILLQIHLILSESVQDRLGPRRRQSQATLLSHKQNLITGSANSPLSSPYNQFYLTNNVNSPHNGKFPIGLNLTEKNSLLNKTKNTQ